MTVSPPHRPASIGRYRATRVLDEGGLAESTWKGTRTAAPTRTSAIWLGTDDETGRDVVFKAYRAAPHIYKNEVRVHRAMIDCPRFARMLAHDDDRMVIVKEYVSGTTSNGHRRIDHKGRTLGTTPPLVATVPQARRLLADVLEAVAFAQRQGLVGDHLLAGWAFSSCKNGLGALGSAESNVIIGDRATGIDMCNSPVGEWLPFELAHGAVLRALWLNRASSKAPPPLLGDIQHYEPRAFSSGEASRELLSKLATARLLALRDIDFELADVIRRYSGNAITLHAAVAALAGAVEPVSRQQRRQAARRAARAL